MDVSNFVKNAKFSAIRMVANAASKYDDVAPFYFGEPDFDTPLPIVEEACKEWRNHKTHYTPNKGIKDLREAVAKYHANDLAPDPEKNICISNGGSDGIRIALRAILNPGDEVICTTPCWSNYFSQIAMYDGVMVEVPSYEENGFRPKPEDIEKAITDKTKAIIINFPCNPTGVILDEETARGIADIINRHDIYLLADEVYSKLIYEGKEHISPTKFIDDKDKIIYLNSFSKMFAMTGWRLAYVIASEKVASAMGHITECGPSCFPEPTQRAGIVALESCLGEIEVMRESYDRRRKLMLDLLKDIPHIHPNNPEGAFYIFINIKETGMNDVDFCMDLLEKEHVGFVPGSGFGDAGAGYVRVSYATSDENIKEGMRRLKKYMEENF